MKHILTTVLMACVIVFGLCIFPAYGEGGLFGDDSNSVGTSRSSSRANTLYVGPGQMYSKIQNAINAATAGDTIRVYNGTYYESININKRLDVIGNGSVNTIIISTSGYTCSISANACKFIGFNVTGNMTGIYIDADNCIINNSVVWNTGQDGIYIYESSNTRINNYTSIENNNGIFMLRSDNNDIRWVNCSNNSGRGISLSDSDENKIRNSIFNYNRFRGIQLTDSDNNTIFLNEVKDAYLELVRLYSGSNNNYIYLNNFINTSGSVVVQDDGNLNSWNLSYSGNHWSNWTSPDSNSDGIVDKPFIITGNAGSTDLYPLVEKLDLSGATIEPKGTVVLVRTGQKYSNIHDALDNAIDGDTIRVWDGMYKGGFELNKRISIIGNGSGKTHIISNYFGIDYYFDSLIRISKNNCKISELEFNGYRTGSRIPWGININSESNRIYNCSFKKVNTGIEVERGNNLIENCTLIDGRFGLYLDGSYNNYSELNKIFNMNISEFSKGIYVRYSNNTLLKNIELFNNGMGIDLENQGGTTIQDCNIYIYNNYGNGINLERAHNNTIIQNRIYNGKIGIYLYKSLNNSIKNNSILNNSDYGIKLQSQSELNSIFHNDFISNNVGDKQGLDNGTTNIWNSSTAGNHWSEWTTPDVNDDGIVDVSYSLAGNGNAKDYYPLVNPINVPIEPPKQEKGRVINTRTGQNYSKIQDAVDNASYGDTIRIWGGVYYENVLIKKSLTLIGNSSQTTIIDGMGSGTVIRINSSWNNITNLKIRNSTVDGINYHWKYTGIHLESWFNVISNCDFESNINHGINIETSFSNTIENCTFTDNNIGINLDYSKYNIIKYCNFSSNIFSGINLSNSDHNNIFNCSISTQENGFYLSNSKRNYITRNIINSNYYGIGSRNSKYNEILYNLINNNSLAINFDYGNYNNIILGNSFVKNLIHNKNSQAIDNGMNNDWNTSSKGNYWSDWTTPDFNSDGIVDKPYNLSGNANDKDYYPLVQPIVEIPVPPPNKPPKILTANIETAYVGKLYSVNYTATDPDTPIKDLIWDMETNASWLAFSSSQELYGTPKSSDIGSYWVGISVSDGKLSDISNSTINVLRTVEPPQPGKGRVINIRTQQKYTKIQDAIDNASSGDTIRVWAGIYKEHIEIHKSIDLIGNGSDVTTIKGPQQYNTTSVFADNCNITGFSIFGSGTSYWAAGISVYWAGNCRIINCNLSRNRNGIRIINSNSNVISNNIFYKNFYYGVWINSSEKSNPSLFNTVMNNTFIENRYFGVFIDKNCNNNQIYRNVFIGNMWSVNCTCNQGKDNGFKNKWNSSIAGNFWSDWTSPDNNSDGIVDFPYNIHGNSGSKDYYPLANKSGGGYKPPKGKPQIKYTNIADKSYNVSVNFSKIEIDFSKSMNRSSVESALSISPQVNYSLSWAENDTKLIITFTEPLEFNTSYKITIDTGAKDKLGNNLNEPLELEFTTERKGVEDDPKDPVDPDDPVKDWITEYIGIISLLVIIQIIIIILLFMVVLKRRKRSEELEEEKAVRSDGRQEIESDMQIRGGNIADEYQYDEIFSNGSYQLIKELKTEALSSEKPSTSGLSKDEMLGKFQKKFEKGEISKETFESIRDSFKGK